MSVATPVPLTRTEADALRIIQEFMDTRGVTPSRRELAVELELASSSGAQRYIDALALKGWILRIPKARCGVQILHRVPSVVETPYEVTERGCAYLAEVHA